MESGVRMPLRPYLSLLLILKDSGGENEEELRKTIREVNSRFVAKEEILSDNLYYYDFSSKTVKIIF